MDFQVLQSIKTIITKMKINLTGVHPNTYEGEVKSELSALQYPIEVTATKKFYIEEGDDEVFVKWVVYLPENKDYTHAAWFLTDNEEINEWVTKYWNNANQSTTPEDNKGE